MELSQMVSVPITWLVSKKDGKVCYTFSKPELKAERILSMTILGHDDIQEVWPGIEIGYLGTFLKWRSPF